MHRAACTAFSAAASTASHVCNDTPRVGGGTLEVATQHVSALCFCGCRKRAEELDSLWWAQHHATISEHGEKGHKPADAPAPEAMQADLEPAGPTVQAGYVEASLEHRRIYPIYWPGAARALVRGTWFMELGQGKGWVPLPHPVAATLEIRWQQRCVQLAIHRDLVT